MMCMTCRRHAGPPLGPSCWAVNLGSQLETLLLADMWRMRADNLLAASLLAPGQQLDRPLLPSILYSSGEGGTGGVQPPASQPTGGLPDLPEAVELFQWEHDEGAQEEGEQWILELACSDDSILHPPALADRADSHATATSSCPPCTPARAGIS